MASFLYNWFWRGLEMLGLYKKKGTIVFVGLDNAGKTTLMNMLKNNMLGQSMPTQKPTMEEFAMGSITFNAFDLGGHSIARRTWRDYLPMASGIIFLVDVADPERFAEARTELDALLAEEDLATTPIAVLGTKIDVPGKACSEDQVREFMGLVQTWGKEVAANGATVTTNGIRPIELFMCSITRRQGYAEAFQWIAQFM